MNKNNLKKLKYNNLWVDYGLLTPEILQTQVKEFVNGGDKNTEHYRYNTFKRYLKLHPELLDNQIIRLFNIIKIEPDISMANSMAIDVLRMKPLSESQFKIVSDLLIQTFGGKMQKYIDFEIILRQK